MSVTCPPILAGSKELRYLLLLNGSNISRIQLKKVRVWYSTSFCFYFSWFLCVCQIWSTPRNRFQFLEVWPHFPVSTRFGFLLRWTSVSCCPQPQPLCYTLSSTNGHFEKCFSFCHFWQRTVSWILLTGYKKWRSSTTLGSRRISPLLLYGTAKTLQARGGFCRAQLLTNQSKVTLRITARPGCWI